MATFRARIPHVAGTGIGHTDIRYYSSLTGSFYEAYFPPELLAVEKALDFPDEADFLLVVLRRRHHDRLPGLQQRRQHLRQEARL